LTDPTWASTGGATPRFISCMPDGDLLLAANEDTDSLTAAALNATRHEALKFQPLLQTESPVCVIFRKAQP